MNDVSTIDESANLIDESDNIIDESTEDGMEQGKGWKKCRLDLNKFLNIFVFKIILTLTKALESPFHVKKINLVNTQPKIKLLIMTKPIFPKLMSRRMNFQELFRRKKRFSNPMIPKIQTSRWF